MYKRQQIILIAVLLLLVVGNQKSVSGEPVTYIVNVDTSIISGQDGYLDFQFNPGDSSAEAATATITDFQTIGGSLANSAVLTGDASGLLPGALTLDNGTVFNDIFQGFVYGNSFGLDVTLSGQAIDNPAGTTGSSFAISLYAADGITPLLTTDPNGSVVTINLDANGTTSAETFPQSPANSIPAAVVTSAVPEPSSFILFVAALPTVLLALRRQPPIRSSA